MKSTFLAIVGIAATSAMSCSWDTAATSCIGSSENQACKDMVDTKNTCAAAASAAVTATGDEAAVADIVAAALKEGCILSTDKKIQHKAIYCAALACAVDTLEETVGADVHTCRAAKSEEACKQATALLAVAQAVADALVDTEAGQAQLKENRLKVPGDIAKLKEEARDVECSSSTALCISAVLAVLPIFASLL